LLTIHCFITVVTYCDWLNVFDLSEVDERKLNKLGNYSLSLFRKVNVVVLLTAALTFQWQVVAQSATEIASAQSTFKFVANVLGNFQRTGRLYDEIGIDGSEYQHFIELLESTYEEFTRNFSPVSEFCQFYHDPKNGIMEIEERAVLGFQYLPDLSGRVENFQRLNRQFEQDVLESYGGQVLERIHQLKTNTTSFEYLPIQDLDATEIVNFADTACR